MQNTCPLRSSAGFLVLPLVSPFPTSLSWPASMRACFLLGCCLLLTAVQGPCLVFAGRWLTQTASPNPFLAPAGSGASPAPAAPDGSVVGASPPPTAAALPMGGGPIPAAPISPSLAAAPSQAAAAPSPEAEGPLLPAAAPAAAPAPEAGAAAPAPEAGVAAVQGPCACSDTGVSGGANTSTVGCGQWDLVSGSNRFTCFVVVGLLGCGCCSVRALWLLPSGRALVERTPCKLCLRCGKICEVLASQQLSCPAPNSQGCRGDCSTH